MALSKPITISNWKSGMHVSPYAGFSQMRGIDPFAIPGVAKIERKFLPFTTAGTAISSLVNFQVFDPNNGTVYALTADGKLYLVETASYSQVTGTGYNGTTEATAANGNGLAYWKGCIWRARNNLLDYYDIANTTWHYAKFGTFSTTRTGRIPLFVGQDDKLYIGNGRKLDYLAESGTFSPAAETGMGTITNGVTLSQDYIITCFAELGNNLMIGTVYGTAGTPRGADIFPWSRDTTESFSLPIRINTEGVNVMETTNNLLYISAGLHGDIYISNGVSFSLFAKLPLDGANNKGNVQVYSDAMDFYGDQLLIGATQLVNSANQILNPMGVYSCISGAVRFMGNNTHASDGSDGAIITISSIISISPTKFLVAWRKAIIDGATTYGIDYLVTSSAVIPTYGAYMESEMYLVGSDREPATLEHFDFYLNKPLASGDGIRLSYRTSDSGSYTEIFTLDFANYRAVNTYSFDTSITGIKTVQFKISLTCTGVDSPELRAIIIS